MKGKRAVDDTPTHGFSYWGDGGEPPPTSQKFAHFFPSEKMPRSILPPPPRHQIFILSPTREEPASTLPSDEWYFYGNGDGKRHEVTSFRLDRRVRRSSYILTETEQTLIGKLSKGDMIAHEAKYHATCLADLYRRADWFQFGSSYSDDEKQKQSSAFASVIWLIKCSIDFTESEEKEVIFKLSELVKLYTRRLRELNVKATTRVHSTRLKERILSQFEDIHANPKGREV